MKGKRRILRWLVPSVVIVCVATWFALPYIVPSDVLFRWSKSSLNAYAAKVIAPGSTALQHPPGRLGFFNVLKVEPLPNGFVFQHNSCNPFDPATVRVDDVVFVKWHDSYLLHLVKEIRNGEFLIGNNIGKVNGWVPAAAIVGKVTAVSE